MFKTNVWYDVLGVLNANPAQTQTHCPLNTSDKAVTLHLLLSKPFIQKTFLNHSVLTVGKLALYPVPPPIRYSVFDYLKQRLLSTKPVCCRIT